MVESQPESARTLRRFLLSLPLECQFKFSNEVRKQIRKAIFLALSNNGTDLKWIFPFETSSPENITTKLDQTNWMLNKYYSEFSDHQSGYHGNKPCAKIFRKGEPVIRCLTCGVDEACALCNDCYNPDYHVNHKIHIAICQLDNGGICDCGDPEAWQTLPKCSHADDNTDDYYEKFEQIPKYMIENVVDVVRILLDYVIDVMSQAKLQFENADTLSTSTIEIKSINSTLDAKKYGYDQNDFVDKNSPKYCLILYNDQIRHYRDAVQRIHLASKKVQQFAEMVTEKVHYYGKAKVITSQDIKLLQDRQKILNSTGLATCIRSERDVFREEMCDEILIWIIDFANSELFNFNQELRNSFCKVFLERWNIGLLLKSDYGSNYEYKVGTLDSNFKIPKIPSNKNNSKPTISHWRFEPSKWSIPEELCIECDYNLDDKDYDPSSSHLGSRLQYLLYFDIRFWKSIRVKLNDMLNATIVTNLTYKNIVAAQYFDIYPSVADMFLTIDREPECSMMSTISMQLFTCPSNSSSIIKYGGVSKIFATVYGYLNSGEVKSPSNVEIIQEICMKSLKNGRWSRLFVDMGYLFSKGRDADTILTNNIIPIACDILALFQGRPVIKREKENHIEYESADYTAFFNTISAIYKFAEYIARCLTSLENIEFQTKKAISKNAIVYIIQFLLRLENNDYPGIVEENVDINLLSNREVLKDEIGNNLIWNYRIDEAKVSFLHPLHSFLSVSIELAHIETQEELTAILEEAVRQSFAPGTPNPLTSIFEYPIRTIVLMSQIKSGFWVRNGYTVRSQLHLYRNSGLREHGYLRDLFLTQVFVCSCDPNLVCFLILHRWLLINGWIDEGESIYDQKTLPYMLEECVLFFMHILTVDLHLRGLSEEAVSEENIKREIIHSLCFGPASYTKLCSQISDHITAEKRFEIILQSITNYTGPTGSNDTGIYTLKEKYLEKVNPFYYNYSTNLRDECIKFVKERKRVKTGENLDDIVISPVVGTSNDFRIHKHIGNFSTSPYFASFIIKTLKHVTSDAGSINENLIESTLHLIHTCSLETAINVEKYGTFYKNFFYYSEKLQASIASVLYDILANEKLKKHHSKIRYIFKIFENKYGDVTESLQKTVSNFTPRKLEINTIPTLDETESERKKRIAQERQAKLLAKFKKQQSSFLKNNVETSEYSDIEMEVCDDDKSWKFPEQHCILCQNAAEDAGPFGIITYISKSSEFRNVPFNDKYWFLRSFSDCANLDEEEHDHSIDPDCRACSPRSPNWSTFMNSVEESSVVGPGFSNPAQVESKLVSVSCGHGMHFQCYVNFLSNNKNRSSQITRNSPENTEHKEFLCPLCKALNNMFIPVLWTSNNRDLAEYLQPSTKRDPFEYLTNELVQDNDWFKNFTAIADKDIDDLSILTPSSMEIISLNGSQDLSPPQLQFKSLLEGLFQTISLLTFPQVYKADCIFLLANSIKSTEISLRGVSCDDELVINQLSNNCLINLRVLNEFRNTCIMMKIKNWIPIPTPRSDAYAKMMTIILSLSLSSFNASILEVDFFDCLVNIVPIPSIGMSFNSIVDKCFLGLLIQNLNILVSELSAQNYYMNNDFNFNDIPTIPQTDKDSAMWAAAAFKQLRAPQGSTYEEQDIMNDERFGYVIYSLLVKATTPFLRRAAILASVQCADSNSIDFSKYSNNKVEADRLCAFLNIKTIKECLELFVGGSSYERVVFQNFLNFLKTAKPNELIEIRKSMEYPGIIKLCDLPNRLDFFFSNYYYSDKYNYPYTFIEDPAVCLFCGEIVDAQKCGIGSKEGQCTTHYLKECPNNIGIFLLPKERTLLLLHRNGGSFHSVPFLDQHGELPGESKKAKALYLMKPRYNDFIKNVWLQHNVPNIIVRNLDSVLDAGGWDTL